MALIMNGKATIKRTVTHEVEFSLAGADIAGMFWGLDADQQAEFFNELATRARFLTQLQAIVESPRLSTYGRQIMSEIGEYASDECADMCLAEIRAMLPAAMKDMEIVWAVRQMRVALEEIERNASTAMNGFPEDAPATVEYLGGLARDGLIPAKRSNES